MARDYIKPNRSALAEGVEMLDARSSLKSSEQQSRVGGDANNFISTSVIRNSHSYPSGVFWPKGIQSLAIRSSPQDGRVRLPIRIVR